MNPNYTSSRRTNAAWIFRLLSSCYSVIILLIVYNSVLEHLVENKIVFYNFCCCLLYFKLRAHGTILFSVKCSLEMCSYNPARFQRHFNVQTTSSQRYGRCIDVETNCVRTFTAKWVIIFFFPITVSNQSTIFWQTSIWMLFARNSWKSGHHLKLKLVKRLIDWLINWLKLQTCTYYMTVSKTQTLFLHTFNKYILYF